MKRAACLLVLAACKQHKPPPVDAVSLGATYGCVHLTSGERACFGDFPNGTSALVATKVDVPDPDPGAHPPTTPGPDAPADTVEVANGARHKCARVKNGTVYCWGANDHHQLADGSTTPREAPVPIMGLIGVKSIVAAGDSTCVLMGKEVRCWGANDHGQLSDGTRNEHTVPTPLKFAPPP